MLKKIKILFFIKGATPTPSDMLAASEISAQVCFRNATYVDGVDEKCDGVAGAVPACYKGFPTAEQAVAKQQAELAKLQKQFGEVAAPKKATSENEKVKEEKTESDISKNNKAAGNTTGKPPAWNPNVNPPA